MNIISVEIRRSAIERNIETQGKLTVLNGQDAFLFNCYTLELADKDNAPGISNIPCGVYLCEKVPATSKIPYQHISILNVANRTGICIHIGNYAAGVHPDVLGCILVGSGYADINKDGYTDIINSTGTFHKLMEILPDNFKLIIK